MRSKEKDILFTDDYVLSRDGYQKPGRRVVVIHASRKHMKVSKIKTIKGKEDKVKTKRIIPLEDNYKCLPKKSGVDKVIYSKDRNEKLISRTDKRFKSSGERLTDRDFSKVRRKHK